MPFIYRHRQNGKLYTIEQILVDIRFTNGNEFAGVYAHPYKWETKNNDPFHTDVIFHKTQGLLKEVKEAEGRKWVDDNFERVAELLKY